MQNKSSDFNIMQEQVTILVIYTGGTIGMHIDNETGALVPVNFDEISKEIPALQDYNITIDSWSFDPPIDSSNMDTKSWIAIANVIQENYENYDGFVVLHGSDTMAYTASALSFMLENLNKPVIFTGSQLPMGMLRTDGRDNFIASILIASEKEEDTPKVPEVAIYFENQLFRANRTFKYNAENFMAFRSGNYPELAHAGINIDYNEKYIAHPNFKKLKVHKTLETNIALLHLYPGINKSFVQSILDIPNLKGLVIKTYGAGNAPTAAWFIESIKKAIDAGVQIVNVSQCPEGRVDMGKYQTSLELERIGVISGLDITTESALAKMMYLLGRGVPHKTFCSLFQTSLRGEISNRKQ
ncbi:MAG: asparaginase [Bacteroidota bacterium]